ACIASPLRRARSAACSGGDFSIFSEFLHPAFRTSSRLLSDYCCLVAQPDRPKHRLWRVGHATPVPGWRPCRGETIVSSSIKQHPITLVVVAVWSVGGARANAGGVCDWNATGGDIVGASKPPAAISYRTMAIVQSAVYEAVNAITSRYLPDGVALDAAPGASVA